MIKLLKWSAAGLVALLVMSNVWIISTTSTRLVRDTRQLHGAQIGLVFGTSKLLKNGDPNPFFENRMEAAYQLLLSGKVDKLLLSGSHDSIYYNEPRAMKAVLLRMGANEADLILDQQGSRTFHSLVRLRDIYGYHRCILVTQQYHAYRSLFLANYLGVDAVCYVAKTPEKRNHLRALSRELLARTKAILDVYVLRI